MLASFANTATGFDRPVCLKLEIGQDCSHAELRTKIPGNKKIVPSHPSQACQKTHFLMGEVRFLVLPVDYLRSRHRKRCSAFRLQPAAYPERQLVQEHIRGAVMVEVKLCWLALDFREDGSGQADPETNSSV